MVRAVKVSFANYVLGWAENMAAKQCQVVAKCAMQSADDVVANNLIVNQQSQSECTTPSTMSSQQGGASTAGSSDGPSVRVLDLLLGNNFDFRASSTLSSGVQRCSCR